MMIYENEIIILLDNDFVYATFEPMKKYLKIIWKENVKNLTTKEAIEYSQKVFRQIEKLNPKYVLQDVSKVKLHYTPEYINWITNELTPHLPSLGVKKIVYVTSNNILTKVGLELINSIAQKKLGSAVERNMATSIRQAEKWLFDNDK